VRPIAPEPLPLPAVVPPAPPRTIVHAVPAVAHGASPSIAVRPTPARKPPVMPRRGTKADPDGTIDPYR
jgi:hypothetical protein